MRQILRKLLHMGVAGAALASTAAAVAQAGSGKSSTTPPATRAGSAKAATPVPVPRAEFIATMDGEFRKMDLDKNGILTKKEAEDYGRAMSAAALDNRRRELFAALDSDHNGALSAQEFAKLQLAPPPTSAAPALGQFDVNRDGQVTLVEYRTAKLQRFDAMDADKDGIVSPAEMKAAGLIK